MKDTTGQILYVGKAKRLRDRVRSYFAPPVKLGPKTSQLVALIDKIDHIEVQSELEALLLESKLIKRFKPPYNIASKDDKSPYYIHVTREEYPRPIINHLQKGAIAGPFLNRVAPSKILRQLRHISPFCTAPRPVKKPCLYSHLGLCHPCPATGDRTGYLKNIFRLKKMLHGHFHSVSSDLARQMNSYSKSQNYEEATKHRDQLADLNQLLSTPISPDDYLVNPNLASDLRQQSLNSLFSALSASHLALSALNRIEFYDNSHLAGTSPASAMTVAINGEITPKNYRHFTLHTSNDISMMQEVLTRRLKTDWPTPDLIVLDGGLPQLSIVTWSIPTIALAKREEIIYFLNSPPLKLPRSHPGLQLLMRLRDEAHRFSHRLHHKHRNSILVNN